MGKLTLILIVFFIAMIACIPIGYAIRYYTAPVLGRIEVQVQTHTAEYMMTAYNYFFDLKGVINGNKQSVCNVKETLTAICDQDEKDRLQITIAGIKNQIARDVQQYNADAAKEWTVGQFRDWSIPASMSTEIDCDNYSQGD